VNSTRFTAFNSYRLKDKGFDWVIGRRRITVQPPPSGLAKIFILKPIKETFLIRPLDQFRNQITDAHLFQDAFLIELETGGVVF
jgi:hypothetical protein